MSAPALQPLVGIFQKELDLCQPGPFLALARIPRSNGGDVLTALEELAVQRAWETFMPPHTWRLHKEALGSFERILPPLMPPLGREE